MIRLRHVFIIFTSFTLCFAATDPALVKENIAKFKQQLSTEFKFNHAELDTVLSHAQYDKNVIKKIQTPYEEKSYTQYRKLFISKSKILRGKTFMQKHGPYLDLISKSYGIPKEIIVAIIGVESNFQPIHTPHLALNSLYTLAFYYPKRADFFRYELAQYLLLCRELGVSPESLHSSYAGALGIPQFMPSSYRRLAKTTAKNHKPNLFNDNADAITSIANYLYHYGWVTGAPTSIKAIVDNKKNLEKVNLNTIYTIEELNKMGIRFATKICPCTKVRLLNLHDKHYADTWFGLANHTVIKKYNNSDLYALAVTELADKIKKTT